MIASELQRKMIKRLLKPSTKDRPVRDVDFQEVLGRVKIEIDRVVDTSRIPGINGEDLEGLLIMKTYQILQRGEYLPADGIKPNPLFYRAYRNLVRDMIRGIQVMERQGLDQDGVHYSYLTTFPDLDEVRNVAFIDDDEDTYVPLNLPPQYMVYQEFDD